MPIYSFYIEFGKKFNIGQVEKGRIGTVCISVSRDTWSRRYL